MARSVGNIGPYRLLNATHTGHTCQIWQAYDDVKQCVVGVKLLLERFRHDREQIGYLRWEHMVGEKVRHPRIIEILDFGRDRNDYYLAMEWFPAPNMKQRILHSMDTILPRLPLIVEQSAEALAHFHRMGWVHRDIKPDNFLVADDGVVKLIDFALARRAQTGLARLFARRSKVQGTRSYMAPEQIRGGALDQRADIYSYGCLLFELLAGKPPFTGANSNELLNKHLRSSPPSLEAANNNVTPEFAQLVRRLMAKEPADRPKSVDEFLGEFRRLRPLKRMPTPTTSA